MKEAAGEANMTVITIVLIAIVLAVGTIIVTNLMGSTETKSACTNAGGVYQGTTCYKASACTTDTKGTVNCSGSAKYTCTKNNGQMQCQ